jgi:hypothetical protein
LQDLICTACPAPVNVTRDERLKRSGRPLC